MGGGPQDPREDVYCPRTWAVIATFSAHCPNVVATVRVSPGAYFVDKPLTRTTNGMITNFDDHAVDLLTCGFAL
jgi:hypothetical protein